jgi:cytochrome c-type biogenesis protein CcmE
MKKKYLIGVVLGVAALIVAFFALDTKQIEYGTFARAAETGRMVQVKGVWVKDQPVTMDHSMFTFYMRDDSNRIMQVKYDGGKPNNFEVSREVVCKGKLEGDHFVAKDILTKCPSKYEGTADQIKR